MTVSTSNAISGPFLPNGATTIFPFTFTAPSNAEVEVLSAIGTVVSVVSPDLYTVARTIGGGGTVTFGVAPASGPSLYIKMKPLFTQDISFEPGGAITADALNRIADRAAARDQFLNEGLARAIVTLPGDTPPAMAPASVRANKLMAFGPDGGSVFDISADAVRSLLSAVIGGFSGIASAVSYLALGLGAVTRSVQDKLRGVVEPEDFGAIGDGSLHPLSERFASLAAAQVVYPFATSLTQQIDYCAIVAAINSQTFNNYAAFYQSGPEVRLRDGALYRMGADVLQLKKSVKIRGSASGQAWSSMAAIQWAAGSTGIIVHRYNTIGAGLEGVPTTGADSVVLEGFRILGTRGAADAFGGHAIWMRSRALCRDLYIEDFEGNGYHIVAAAGGAPDVEGNANCFGIYGGRVQDCNHGIYCDGPDVNAGSGFGVDVSNNRRWGLWDGSFLGNTWTGVHSADNGAEFSGATPIRSAYATRGGLTYHAVPSATTAQLVATEPGTDRTIWRACNATSYAIAWTGGQALGTYRSGGAYYTDDATNRSTFVGCYSEGGQGLIWLASNTLLIGGAVTETPVVTGTSIEGRFNRVWSRSGFQSEGLTTANKIVDAVLGGDPDNGDVLRWSHSDDTTGFRDWRMRRSGADWVVDNANSGARIAFTLTGELTARQFGTSAPIPYVFALDFIALGNGSNGRRQTTGTAAPVAGAWAQGDIVWNIGATASGKVGWVCTAAGTPGTWKPFGAIDA